MVSSKFMYNASFIRGEVQSKKYLNIIIILKCLFLLVFILKTRNNTSNNNNYKKFTFVGGVVGEMYVLYR